MNCFLDEVRGSATLDGEGNIDFALWQPRGKYPKKLDGFLSQEYLPKFFLERGTNRFCIWSQISENAKHKKRRKSQSHPCS